MVLILCLLLQESTILKMTFHGTDRELAQGAIERLELEHREIEARVWLIRVESGTPEEWARRLTSVLPEGKFTGEPGSAEEIDRIRRGEIVLQK